MSDSIQHECGVALIRLLKPLSYYKEKYNDVHYGLTKMYLLMEKQHNRGQDGVGLATIKLDAEPGSKYYDRIRSVDNQGIKKIFEGIFSQFSSLSHDEKNVLDDMEKVKAEFPYMGELLLGHLRYGTTEGKGILSCHPRIRPNNWMTRTLMIAGNFGLTNVGELFDNLIQLGQFPREKSGSTTILEKVGHFLDVENQRLFDKYKADGLNNAQITKKIAQHLDVQNILKESAKDFDGGYVMAGLIGHGDAFVLRDPNGIRPAFYYQDDEIVVVASERPAIQTIMDVSIRDVKEVEPGTALIVKKNGEVINARIIPERENAACSFERIYFSRGGDADIYKERKKLGKNLVPAILKKIDYDFKNTVFSFIPNTSEIAFYGMIEEIHLQFQQHIFEQANKGNWENDRLQKELQSLPRIEKIALKDVKLRTFITEDASRNDMVHHVYDVTYGVVKNDVDTLVIIDDSIVRGTTLKESILTMLNRLKPKKIIVVSSAPQIRFPDCYGIEMARMDSFVAFRAVVEILQERGQEQVIYNIYDRCIEEIKKPDSQIYNCVKDIYNGISADEISQKIADLVKPDHMTRDVELIFQTIEGLHDACPKNKGDWYFTGNYPTPGGNKTALKEFIKYFEQIFSNKIEKND